MAAFFPALTEQHRTFIGAQPIFFVASAPGAGRVNLSPKGMNTFRVLSANRVAYLDLTGSGNETAAHLLDNGRVTVMFCSFGDKPLILRLYGRGRVHHPGHPAWEELAPDFPELAGSRQLIDIEVDQVQTSCGFAVPRMELIEQRPTLVKWARDKGDEAMALYRQTKNRKSIDGLPTGLPE